MLAPYLVAQIPSLRPVIPARRKKAHPLELRTCPPGAVSALSSQILNAVTTKGRRNGDESVD
jgi:hypothetical protein